MTTDPVRIPPAPSSLLDAVHEVARLAGEVALRYFRSALAIELKPDGSEVTRADREAEAEACRWIQRRFPGDSIVGEELGMQGGNSDRLWYIDPIDGTRSYVRGVPLWGSMIAVREGATVLAGAISCPATGDLVAAARGHGCWHNGARTHVSDVAELSRSTVLATDAEFRRNPARALKWSALSTHVAAARTWGDCYGYVLVATGRSELMTDDRLSPWDVAALVPIIEEAGGVFTDWRGQPGMGLDGIASNARLATTFRTLLGVPEGSLAERPSRQPAG
jgi:histidinol phosphatase-like enzyme (inositol monophosphatase family)